ncbi:hypothetical protein TTHERM_00277600 (macronuclear) [Tetrahymena thermophila SB210]|uniref:Uncharacterized protein n=1 Tax=Tetrahymena thermophila (strain SB210) TaxID=312017 RepID=I7M1V8_TETTS|nr:hypothetical protein TTHERM_00277600 [Tetrahymena thermophila SB210]EAR97873.2 hypothetical protein TTHERM_00277600 [Tetrahymena thermophila SB210]|eukprot:XP_001018118.2 hypothetical protein TTHERM_00277600 [Tetrahymena thermophila SB210]
MEQENLQNYTLYDQDKKIMEILNQQRDQLEDDFLTSQQLEDHHFEQIGDNGTDELYSQKNQINQFFQSLQKIKKQESYLVQFHKEQKRQDKNFSHEEIIKFLADNSCMSKVYYNCADNFQNHFKSFFQRDILAKEEVFGKIIQNFDYANQRQPTNEFKKIKNFFIDYLKIADKQQQKKEFKEISKILNDKFLNQMSLDREIVDIGQKIIDSLENIGDKSKRIKLEDLSVLQYMFYHVYSIFVDNGDQTQHGGKFKKKMYPIAFLIGYAFNFSQKLQQIQELINSGRRSQKSQQETEQEEKLKKRQFKNMHNYIHNQNTQKKVEFILQYEMLANEQLFQYLNNLQQSKNDLQINMETQIDYFLLGMNIIFQHTYSYEQISLNKKEQFKYIIQEIIYFQYHLGNAIHHLNIKYLEQDGFLNKFQEKISNSGPELQFSFLEVFKRLQKNLGIFIETNHDEKTQILPVIIPYIRIGEEDEDSVQPENISQNQKKRLIKNYKYNMILMQKFYLYEQRQNLKNEKKGNSRKVSRLYMRDDIFGIQFKQKEIIENIKKGQQLVLPSNLNFTYGGLFYNLFWNNVLTTIHGNILEPQLHLLQNFCKYIQIKTQFYGMGSQENQQLEIFNQCRKIQDLMLYEQAKCFIQQCKQYKRGNLQLFSLINKSLLEKIVMMDGNKISISKYPQLNKNNKQKCELLKSIQQIQKKMKYTIQNSINIDFINEQNIYKISIKQDIINIWISRIKNFGDLENINKTFIQRMKFYGPKEYLGIEFEDQQRKNQSIQNQQQQLSEGSRNQQAPPKIKAIKKDRKRKTKKMNSQMPVIDNDLNVSDQIQSQQGQLLENLPMQQVQIENAQDNQPNINQVEQPNNQQQQQNINAVCGFNEINMVPGNQQQAWIYQMYFPQNYQQAYDNNFRAVPLPNMVPDAQQQHWIYELQFPDEQGIDEQHEEQQQIQENGQNNQVPQQMEEEEEEEQKQEVYYNPDNDFPHMQYIYSTPYNYNNNEIYQNQVNSYWDRTTNQNYNNGQLQQQQNDLYISQFDTLNFFDNDVNNNNNNNNDKYNN